MPLDFPNSPIDDAYYQGWLNQYAGLKVWDYIGSPVGTKPIIPVPPTTTTTTTAAPTTTTTTATPTTTTTTTQAPGTVTASLLSLIDLSTNGTNVQPIFKGNISSTGISIVSRGIAVNSTFTPPGTKYAVTGGTTGDFQNLQGPISIPVGSPRWIWAYAEDQAGNSYYSLGNSAATASAFAWHGLATNDLTSGQFDAAYTTSPAQNQIAAVFEVSTAVASIVSSFGVYYRQTGSTQGDPTEQTYADLGWTRVTGSIAAGFTNNPVQNRVRIVINLPTGSGPSQVDYSLKGFVTYTGPNAFTTYTNVYGPVTVQTGNTTTTTTTAAPPAGPLAITGFNFNQDSLDIPIVVYNMTSVNNTGNNGRMSFAMSLQNPSSAIGWTPGVICSKTLNAPTTLIRAQSGNDPSDTPGAVINANPGQTFTIISDKPDSGELWYYRGYLTDGTTTLYSSNIISAQLPNIRITGNGTDLSYNNSSLSATGVLEDMLTGAGLLATDVGFAWGPGTADNILNIQNDIPNGSVTSSFSKSFLPGYPTGTRIYVWAYADCQTSTGITIRVYSRSSRAINI